MPFSAQTSDIARIDAAINEIRFDFICRLEGYVDRLENILDASSSAGSHAVGIEEAAQISHRIAGVAGTFGYAELGRVAQFTESAISSLVSSEAGGVDIAAVTDRIRDLANFAAEVCGEFAHDGYHAQAR